MSIRLRWCFVLFLILSPVLARSDAAVAQAGVNGSSYVSPTFEWSLTWDESWSVETDDSVDGYDYLELTDQLSYVYFEAYTEFAGDALACVSDEKDDLAAQDGVSDIVVGRAASGDPLSGGDGTNAYAVYTMTYTDADGVESDLVEYSECRTLGAGESVLEISQVTIRDAYNDAAPAVQTLLAAITLPGDEPAEPVTASGDDGDDEDRIPGTLTAEEVKSAAEEAANDVVDFFEEVFEDQDVFFIAPFFEIVEGESQAPCSERAIHPGVGSFYCGLNQTIYFDLELETSDASVGGIASPYYTMGHEAGHDVQMTLGIILSDTLTVEKELEADCMAGAFLAWEVDRGVLTEDDVFVLLDLVSALGDPKGTSVTDPGAHGMGSQRVAMVLRGYYNDVDSCGTFEG